VTIVFKLGGSLLTLPELASNLNEALKQRIGNNCLIIAGGGATADLVREWSRIYKLDDEIAHWLAIASLDFNNRFLQHLLKWKAVSSKEEARKHWEIHDSPLLLEMEKYIAAEESLIACSNESQPSEQQYRRDQSVSNLDKFSLLPHDWDTTSDSLAAWAAIRWRASELVLLKSVPIPGGLSASEASKQLKVDANFRSLANQIPLISWCNMRATPITIDTWLMSRSAEQG
jgi:aspartokinase-like uncharacterized kinase